MSILLVTPRWRELCCIVLLAIEEGEYNELPNKSLKGIKNYYLYYSHQYCVGADIKDQDKNLKRFVTISRNNTSVEIFQAMFRLRLLQKESNNGNELEQQIKCVINFDFINKTNGMALKTHLEENLKTVKEGKKIYLYLEIELC